MALGAPRPLLVPAADVLAKNMRAVETAIPSTSPTKGLMSTTTASPSQSKTDASADVRFRRAGADAPPNPVVVLVTRMLAKKSKENDEHRKSAINSIMQNVLPPLEKASSLASRLPDPTVLFLGLVLVVLLVDRYRPHWFAPLLLRIAVVFAFFPLFVVALLWKKTELFAKLREGQNPLSHPAEHRLDAFEAELIAREEQLKKDEEEFKKNREQLDELRKEIFKDPIAHQPHAIVVPSKKAAAMIAAGALGAGYDEDAAQEVETRRKEENLKKSREEWKQRAMDAELDKTETVDDIQKLEVHAATAYAKRTKELKTRATVGTGRPIDRLMGMGGLRKLSNSTRADDMSVNPRYSEASVASSANSTSSRKRLGLFRRRRRTTGASRDTVGTSPDIATPGSP